MTWNESEPTLLPQPPWANRAIGMVRMVLAILMTPFWVVVFLVGKVLRNLLGRGIRLHIFADRMWARTGMYLVGLNREVHGTPIQSGALVANHSSWSDILVLRSIMWVYFISKADVAQWPGVGWLAQMVGTVFIERRRVEAKRQEEILRERIAAQQLLCFFPEGTSTDGMRVLPFKSSLFSAFFGAEVDPELQIQPVSVRYLPHPEAGLPEDFFGWWG
ncbi:MAG: lysophospholipid acyltransferase family protein, partial [Pseudomonadota bacterium]